MIVNCTIHNISLQQSKQIITEKRCTQQCSSCTIGDSIELDLIDNKKQPFTGMTCYIIYCIKGRPCGLIWNIWFCEFKTLNLDSVHKIYLMILACFPFRFYIIGDGI